MRPWSTRAVSPWLKKMSYIGEQITFPREFWNYAKAHPSIYVMRDVLVNHIKRQHSNITVLSLQVHATSIGHKNYTASTNRKAIICNYSLVQSHDMKQRCVVSVRTTTCFCAKQKCPYAKNYTVRFWGLLLNTGDGKLIPLARMEHVWCPWRSTGMTKLLSGMKTTETIPLMQHQKRKFN